MRGKLSIAWRNYRRRLLLFGIPLFGLTALYLYRLGSLIIGLSSAELTQLMTAGSWRAIIDNPLSAPLSTGQWLLLTAFHSHSPWLLRLPSVVIGIITVICFWYILRRWYGHRTAAYGTVVFAVSSWLLHSTRFGGTAILFVAVIPVILATFIAWERYGRQRRNHYLVAIILGVVSFIPGSIWFILLMLGLQHKIVSQAWQQLRTPLARIGWLTTYLVCIAPILYAGFKNNTIWKQWLGLPTVFTEPDNIPHRLVESISFFIWRGPLQPELWLDRLAILTVFTIIMAVLGVIFYARHLTAMRTRLLLALFGLGAIFYALGGPVTFGILIPVIYLIVAAGIGFLLHEWLKVFPKNPIARWAGYILLALIVLMSCSYELRSYFVAWPNATETRAAYRVQP